jgi:hypothetical protein
MAAPDTATLVGITERSVAGEDDASIEAVLARTSAQLEQARFEVALAARVQQRLLDEIARLQELLADAEAERVALREQIDRRDRLLSQIFASRSWRWTQRLRRVIGRP